jgi:formiminoglutamase
MDSKKRTNTREAGGAAKRIVGHFFQKKHLESTFSVFRSPFGPQKYFACHAFKPIACSKYLWPMLQNWLKPLSKPTLRLAAQQADTALGKKITLHGAELPALKKIRVALVGADEAEADAVRRALYPMVGGPAVGSMADLGNLRKADSAQLIPVLYELLTGGILPIVIARSHALARGQFLAYQEAKALVNWAVIDECLRPEVSDHTLEPRHPLLFHFALLGAQSHQVPPEQFDFFEKNNFEMLRLGRSRTVLDESEPLLRDADLLTLHANALKMSELGAVEAPSPSGYFIEEACQLARYAGMSDKLTSFGLYGYEHTRDINAQSAQGLAQVIWYFLDGLFNRKNDYPATLQGMTEYVVDFPALNYQLTFWRSTRSGRWWMQVPLGTKRKHQRHRLVPCSYQDYQGACRQELPDRLLAAFKRF